MLFAVCFADTLRAQPGFDNNRASLPYREHILNLNKASYNAAAARGGARTTTTGPVFDTTRWAHIIDSTWGSGLADTDKLNLFNFYWDTVNTHYAAFVHLPAYNWDSVVGAMQTEIGGGVSKGRFAGIIGNLMTYINDGHSHFYDNTVNYGSAIYQGMPVFRGESGMFGACVTTLHDTAAMVYTADPGHPFGLQPGDVILGYDGIAWTSLVRTILRHQLPNAIYMGSSPEALFHRYIQAAGENWYLFDTINIRKCNGTLVNLPTSLMLGRYYRDFCTEQMAVPGVHKMTYTDYMINYRLTTWGVISGTRVGYVALYDCSDISGDSLYNKVKILVEDSLVNGLILDIRTNYGGSFNAYLKTFDYLTDAGAIDWLGYGARYDTTRTDMMLYPSYYYDFSDADANHFDKRVALLCGPNAVSAGDVMPVMFRRNPYVKLFGKNTAGAFGAYFGLTLPYSDYYGSYQGINFYDAANDTFYLSHTYYPIDSAIWFSQDSVCSNTDNIVTTAVQWINQSLAVNNLTTVQPSVKIFPNPSRGNWNLSIRSQVSEQASVTVFNALGCAVNRQTIQLNPGIQTLKISQVNLPPGSYYVHIVGNTLGSVTRELIIME